MRRVFVIAAVSLLCVTGFCALIGNAEGDSQGCRSSLVKPGRSDDTVWWIYRDADSKENHGEWTNYMTVSGHEKELSEIIKLSLVDSTDPYDGSTCIRVDVNFMQPWVGLAVTSSPDYWGMQKADGYDLSKATKLVFHAKGEKGNESIQVKVAIAGDKPYGDSTKLPAATAWIKLTKNWQSFELPLKGINLKRVITPFVLITDKSHNKSSELTFYLDNIHFIMAKNE